MCEVKSEKQFTGPEWKAECATQSENSLDGRGGGDLSIVVLGVEDLDDIRKRDVGAHSPGLVVGKHDDNLDANDTTAEEDVLGGSVLEDNARVTSLDHVAITEEVHVGTLGTGLARDADLATLRTAVHDEADNAVTSLADNKAGKELELDRLGLGHGAETTEGDALDVELDVVTEAETLADDRAELADALALLADDLLGVGGADDDLLLGGGVADLDAGETVVGKLAGEELGDFAVEDTVCNELVLKAELLECSGHFFSVCWWFFGFIFLLRLA